MGRPKTSFQEAMNAGGIIEEYKSHTTNQNLVVKVKMPDGQVYSYTNVSRPLLEHYLIVQARSTGVSSQSGGTQGGTK
ncbi:uncharacterized protein SPPG_09032 [Spizellomyces punctatus DAOM BR117]|uniref:Uncharacterized protein n=1 Tax=Spizellomyces punctatus (strain DAOM BR117) TaxID=645134 RepID=A0A0L0HLT6_SPIPD|nr:uncharacterized protein SPPG_09032 [Spizellomyces punctatus DAOM BR117]KND02028.1 hypothetical protein SPPG_09032 [Spizellomyces punctatus DAOM BR117]|eukprot:XP_016610067.1 hypothetical protein SPPG_09032 [Spizellomyces punctatus DAOM BR117]